MNALSIKIIVYDTLDLFPIIHTYTTHFSVHYLFVDVSPSSDKHTQRLTRDRLTHTQLNIIG